MRLGANPDGHVKDETRQTGRTVWRVSHPNWMVETMNTNIIRHVEPKRQNVDTAYSDPLPPELIKSGYRFGRRTVTDVRTEHETRTDHIIPCECRCAFGFLTAHDPRCVQTEIIHYWYTVRCDCGCIRIMDWWSVTHGGRLTCNRIACECTPKRFRELYSNLKSVPDARAA